MPELDSCLFSTMWLGMLANRQGKKMQTCFLCMADYYLAANYKLLPVTFSWVDQALLQTEMYLCPTGDTCPMDCTGSQGQLLKMYLWLYLWPRGLLVQLKCWKISVWIHISLETPSSLCLAGGCLFTRPWPTPLCPNVFHNGIHLVLKTALQNPTRIFCLNNCVWMSE